MTALVVTLGLLLVIQQLFWGYTVNKLINKIMSRNFAEYNQVQTPPQPREQVPVDHGIPEDIRSLMEIG